MDRLLFVPFGIAAGLVAGLIGSKLFEQLWGLIDKQEPPNAEHREVEWPKLVAALAIEGAIFRVLKGLTDRGARLSYQRVTGSWPGEEAPEPE